MTSAGEELPVISGSVMRQNLRNPRAAEILGRFLHRRIEIGQRRGYVQVEDRIQAQRIERDDPPEAAVPQPVDGLLRPEDAELHEQRIECAVLAEDLPNPDRSHKGRQDHRHEQKCGQDALCGKVIAIRQPRQR